LCLLGVYQGCQKVSAGFQGRHFYSATKAATALRALGVGYTAKKKKDVSYPSDRNQLWRETTNMTWAHSDLGHPQWPRPMKGDGRSLTGGDPQQLPAPHAQHGGGSGSYESLRWPNKQHKAAAALAAHVRLT